jgi:hypothetical protein
MTLLNEKLGFAVLNKKNGTTPPTFNISNTEHIDALKYCTEAVKTNLAHLCAIDKQMTAGFVIGTTALVFSFIPFNWVITLGGFSYGFYQLGLRQEAYKQYEQSLEALAACCDWALNQGNNSERLLQDLLSQSLETAPLLAMVKTLAPAFTETQFKSFLNDQQEDRLINWLRKNEPTFNPEGKTLTYKMYGYEQGSLSDIGQGLWYVIQNAYQRLKEACGVSSGYPSQMSM